MLLLAERFNMSILKMVSFGVIVDRLLFLSKKESISRKVSESSGHDGALNKRAESMDEIREELLQLAEQITYVFTIT